MLLYKYTINNQLGNCNLDHMHLPRTLNLVLSAKDRCSLQRNSYGQGSVAQGQWMTEGTDMW